MDAKVTLSFDKQIAEKAKLFAKHHNISLSRLTEFLLMKATEKTYVTLEDLPVSDWVSMVAEGEATYERKSRTIKAMKDEYYSSKK